MKKIFTILSVVLIVIGMTACGGKDNENKITLVKHWTGEKTSVKFDVVGNVMSPSEFAEYLQNSVFSAQYAQYLTYVKKLEDCEISDFTFKSDGTYEVILSVSQKPKTLIGSWIQVNNRVTIFLDLSQAFDIQEAGDWELEIRNLTLDNLNLYGELEVVEGTIKVLFDFYGKH